MATVSFRVKRPTADLSSVFAIVYWPGAEVKVYTDVKVQPKLWSRDDKRVLRAHPDAKYLNAQLDRTEERLLACVHAYRAQGKFPRKAELEAALSPDEPMQPVATPPVPEVAATFAAWQAHNPLLSPNTIRTRQTTLRHLECYVRAHKCRLTWALFTADFLPAFGRHLAHVRNLHDGAIWKTVISLKTFLKWAKDRGCPLSGAYQKYTWSKHEPRIHTLTDKELAHLAGLDLTDCPHLDNARSLFLVQCYSGLRFSDVQALRPEQITDTTILVTTKKTDDDLAIPIRPELRPLLEKIKNNDPSIYPLENAVLNRHLKELAQRAGFDEPVQVTRKQLGQTWVETVPRWTIISTHTGRRSAITNLLKQRMLRDAVKKFSGHRTESAFQRYVDVSNHDLQDEFTRLFG